MRTSICPYDHAKHDFAITDDRSPQPQRNMPAVIHDVLIWRQIVAVYSCPEGADQMPYQLEAMWIKKNQS